MAIKVGGTEVISDSRVLSNIASVDEATVTALSDAGVGGGNKIQATASGALANGDLVSVNADGTVSVTTGERQGILESTEYTTGSPQQVATTFDTNADRLVVFYRDSSNSNYGTCVVGTITGETITFGTPVVFSSESTSNMGCTYNSNQGRVVVGYRGQNYGWMQAGLVSGSSITFGSRTYVQFQSTATFTLASDPVNNTVGVGYTNITNSSRFEGILGTISGVSITRGSNTVVLDFNSPGGPSSTYDSNTGNFVFLFADDGNFDRPTTRAAYTNGSQLTLQPNQTTISNTATNGSVAVVFDSDSGDCIFAYANSTSVWARRGVVALNGSVTLGNEVLVTSGETSVVFGKESAVSTGPRSAVISWRSQIDGVYQVSAAPLTIEGNGQLSSGSSFVVTDDGLSNSLAPSYRPASDRLILSYSTSTNNLISATVQDISTPTTSNSYLGIADGAFADGETATVQLVGSINEAQTGLTAGQKYYVQFGGTLATTPDDPEVYAGLALSSTNLLVKG